LDKLVGLSRAIKQEWLNKTVEIYLQTTNEQEIKDILNEYLSYEIKSHTVLRKTREILMNIWVRPKGAAAYVQKEAVKVFQNRRGNKTALNWAMILMAYPIFSDVCGLIGKICMVQDSFTTSWLTEQLLAIWGERPTLIHSTAKILQTLKSLNVIVNLKTGEYKICTQPIADMNTIMVMLMAFLVLNRKAYYETSELSHIPLFFPFDYSVKFEWLHNAPELSIQNFGGKLVVSAVYEQMIKAGNEKDFCNRDQNNQHTLNLQQTCN